MTDPGNNHCWLQNYVNLDSVNRPFEKKSNSKRKTQTLQKYKKKYKLKHVCEKRQTVSLRK